jgi:ribose transport system ATP-binding protein
MEMSCSENLTLTDLRSISKRGAIRRRLARSMVADWCRRLDVRPLEVPDRALEGFSGGNQQKILFAKWLRTEPFVFLLDEPTQGVDIGAKARLHHELVETAAAGAAVVISSSDVDELAAICTRVVIMRAGRVVRQLTKAELTVPNISRAALASEPNGVSK